MILKIKKKNNNWEIIIALFILLIIVLCLPNLHNNDLEEFREERHKQLDIIENETGLSVLSHTAGGIILVNVTSGEMINYTDKTITREGKAIINE